jgi:nucleotide-binding universal stress UspA family protein
VAERVLRQSPCDVLLARSSVSLREGRILVAVDGSRDALAAVRKAACLSLGFAATLEAVAVYDPFFHGGVFGAISGVLSDESAQRFDFRAQEQLHDEIIDLGLEQIYSDYLKQAALLAEQEGASIETRLLAGKSFACVLDHAAESDSALVVVGRHGAHREEISPIGSTSENVARLAATNVLVVMAPAGETAIPELPAEQEAKPLPWDSDAEARLRRVPRMARGMARRAIEAYARERGHRRVTLDVYQEARTGFGMGR